MKSSRARTTVAIWATVMAFATLTCSREPGPATATSRSQLTRLTLNFNQSISYGPLMIAIDEGFFAEEGIAIETASLDSNSALAALVAGKLDVLSTGVRAGVFNVIQRGAPIQAVIGKGHAGPKCCATAFVAPSDMARRIQAAGGSVRGERVAIVRGGMAEYLTARLLARHDLTTDDVVAIPMPQGAPASSSDSIDAVRYISEPSLSVLLNEGGTSVVATTDDVAPGHQAMFVLYGNRLLHDEPELGRRFMRAYLRGLRRWNDVKSDRNVEILSRYSKLPPKIIRQMCWSTTVEDGRINPEDVQPFLDWALGKGYLDGPITAEWWNSAYIDDAVLSLSTGER